MRDSAEQLVRGVRVHMERHPTAVKLAVDLAAWPIALVIAALVRYDLDVGHLQRGMIDDVALACALQANLGMLFGLYVGRWRFGSFEEVAALAKTVLSVTALLFSIRLMGLSGLGLPRSAPLAGGAIALVLTASSRYAWRLTRERGRRPRGEGHVRLLVFGAGDASFQVLTAMLRDPSSPYLPVALLDDNPAKRKLRLLGVPVVGDRHELQRAATTFEADALLVAVPSGDAALLGEIAALADAAGLPVKVLPRVAELFGRVGWTDIRPVSIEDLLGRQTIETDLASVAGYVTNKRVLVTGAGGSIGSELCRQLHTFSPEQLLMLDRDESALHAVQLAVNGTARLDDPDLCLVDIRDFTRVSTVFDQFKPHVIFHAAALKHVPLLETHPSEALQTNVWGTLNVLQAAANAGVERFVNISTDKAADPVNALGTTKRIAERLTATFAADLEQPYLSVRFGNVLGSRGSMIDTFRSQIDAGGPVTVTHPAITRFFMTIPEAVQLVIQAGAIGRPGEVLVLDMGEPMRIADVAQRMVADARRPVRIVYTGLRPGEKLHEVLFAPGERDERPIHPLISHVPVPPLRTSLVYELDPRAPGDALLKTLHDVCEAVCADTEEVVIDLTTPPARRASDRERLRESHDIEEEAYPT